MMSIKRLLTVLIIFFTFLATSFSQDANLALANEELIVLADDLNFGEADIDNPIVTDHYTSNGITHIYYQQTVNQIGIFGATASVHLKNNEVFAADLNFLKGLEKRNIKQQFQVQALEAVARLAIAQNYPLSQTEVIILEADDADPSKPTTISESGISNRVIPLKLVFFEDEGQDLQLAWSVFIDETGDGEYKNFLVNATTGSIEKEINLTISCSFDHDHSHHQHNTTNTRLKNILTKHKATENTKKVQVNNSYNVYPIPVESPNHGARSIEVSPWLANTTASPNGWHQIGATNFTTTRGNNVDAYDDSDNTNSAANGDSDRVDGGVNLEFDNPLDLTASPAANKPAAITNLFYWSNIIHDVWFNYGFDEASGNFQEENYTSQGNGSDYVYAEAQDGSGTCNANMSTPGDGSNPRMQMYVCNDRDGDFDNGVIVHEYGHGISIRLAGGPSNSSCLNNQEQMGEGWSDWYGMVMTIQAGDVANKSRPMGTWLFGQGANGGGIRPYPYNTDMTVNPMTYGTLPESNISVPHGVGSVWATMLWDLTWAMIDKYGWDADLYNGTGGNNKTMALVLEGLKLQPCNPGFVDGRDGILKADSILNGGANSLLIWETFARRGLGFSANQGSTGSKSDGVEAFDLPSYFTVTFEKSADKTTAQLGEPITYSLTATNEQTAVLTDLVFTDYLPDNLEFISASDGGQASGQTITWPATNLAVGESTTRTLVAKVKENLSSVPPALEDDLESGSANWEVIKEIGSANWAIQSSNFHSASNAYHCASNPSESVVNLVTTEVFGVTDQTELIFQHSYDIESGTYNSGEIFGWDGGFVEISTDNGTSWTDLGNNMTQNGYNATLYYGNRPAFVANSNGWVETKVDLSAYANQMAKIRFQMRYDYSVSNDGWYIDDIQITNLGLSAINQAQVSNGTVTSNVVVNNPTEIDFTPYQYEAPITMADYLEIDKNTTNNFVDVQLNDSDPNGIGLSLVTTILEAPMNGTAAIINGDSISYEPTIDFIGSDTIIYQVCNPSNICASDTVFIIINDIDCTDNLTLNLDNEIFSDDYRVNDEINSSGIIKNGSVVRFYAGNAIHLQNGFHAVAGSEFLGRIENCNASVLQEVPPSQLKLTVSNPILNNTLTVHPNPFSHQAIINYQLAKSSKIWIGLHDITGKLVKIIEQQGERNKGAYKVILDSEFIQGGAYWLTMQTNEEIITKKVFLVKD